MKLPPFQWNDWNRDHATIHGVYAKESEEIVRRMTPPYPQSVGSGKWRVRGRTATGRYLQVIFTYHLVAELDYEELTPEEWANVEDGERVVYIIHARPLTDRERSRLRR